MEEQNRSIDHLIEKLELLLKKQSDFSKEVNDLREDIIRLKAQQDRERYAPKPEIAPPKPEITPVKPEMITPPEPEKVQVVEKNNPPASKPEVKPAPVPPVNPPKPPTSPMPASVRYATEQKSDLEKFIGENLINKIGIVITVIGVGIGVKYSIEHQLISPLTRIILGYLVAGGLLGFGIKLKKNYENYSAVLVSGAIAIMYFITFAAYSFYGLIPQTLAFALMVVFTAFTVVAAIKYNNQVIAHIGLVGAYGVPFLLSDGSGRVGILFTYMAIINTGILVIAFKRYWKLLYYSSFFLTWLIFSAWFASDYVWDRHFNLSLIFLSIFFITFYAIFLAYKLIEKEKFGRGDIVLLLINSFIFYALGYAILNGHSTGKQLLGVFTLANAAVHFVVCAVIYKQQLADRNLFFLVAGLVLTFITIAVPVQLDGNWVTLLWAAEAALLFWIGRTKNVPVYEKLSYILMALASASIMQDWSSVTTAMRKGNHMFGELDQRPRFTPIFNIGFLTSILFIAFFSFINYINVKVKQLTTDVMEPVVKFVIPAILLVASYFAFYIEILGYWDQRYADSFVQINGEVIEYRWNHDLWRFENISQLIYLLFFFIVVSLINIVKIKNDLFGKINLLLNAFAVLAFLTQGLYQLSELREIYLNPTQEEYFPVSIFYIYVRYFSFVFLAVMIYVIYRYIHTDFMKGKIPGIGVFFDHLLHITIVWVASSELIAWLDMSGSSQTYKLGLSILWGVYSLLLIIVGIWKKKKHMRVGAIVLFGITLVKLFVYDIASLDTIAKTIVFVSLGILLLIISFLYNKYKKLIADEKEENV